MNLKEIINLKRVESLINIHQQEIETCKLIKHTLNENEARPEVLSVVVLPIFLKYPIIYLKLSEISKNVGNNLYPAEKINDWDIAHMPQSTVINNITPFISMTIFKNENRLVIYDSIEGNKINISWEKSIDDDYESVIIEEGKTELQYIYHNDKINTINFDMDDKFYALILNKKEEIFDFYDNKIKYNSKSKSGVIIDKILLKAFFNELIDSKYLDNDLINKFYNSNNCPDIRFYLNENKVMFKVKGRRNECAEYKIYIDEEVLTPLIYTLRKGKYIITRKIVHSNNRIVELRPKLTQIN